MRRILRVSEAELAMAGQEVAVSPGPEVLVGASADAVAVHDDQGRLVARFRRDDRLAHIRQLDLHADDAGGAENVVDVRVLG